MRIGSIPIHVEWPFLLIAALLGANSVQSWPGNRLVFLLIWVGIVFVSVLVHELGHAFAYRIYGQRPTVTLTAFWGLTHGERELPKARSIAVSLAGPVFAMVFLGIPAILLRDQVFVATGSYKWYLVVYQIGYINLWWSIANLLPILPLDGGNIVRTLWGLRTARLAALGVGTVVAIWLFIIGQSFAAFFIAMLTIMNLGEAMQEGFVGRGRGFGTGMGSSDRYDRPDPPAPRRKEPRPRSRKRRKQPDLALVPPPTLAAKPIDGARLEAAAWDALRNDDPDEAERLLLEATGRSGTSPHLSASVAAVQGRDDEAIRLFVRAFSIKPTPPNLMVAKVIAKAGIATPLAAALLDDPTVEVDAAAELQNHLHYAAAYREAAEVGEQVVADGRRSVAQSSYEVACSWARAGDAEAGLDWLERAVEAGFTAPRLIEGEDDLASVRALPGYASLQRTLHDG